MTENQASTCPNNSILCFYCFGGSLGSTFFQYNIGENNMALILIFFYQHRYLILNQYQMAWGNPSQLHRAGIRAQVSYWYHIGFKMGPKYCINIILGQKFISIIISVSYWVENWLQVLYRYRIRHYTIPINDIFNLNSKILPETWKYFTVHFHVSHSIQSEHGSIWRNIDPREYTE